MYIKLQIWLVCTNLAKVEFCVILRRNTFDLEEGGVGSGVTLSALVPQDAALAVKSEYRRSSSQVQDWV